MTSLKVVVVGDGDVGKTSLLMSYAYNRFPAEYVPTVFDNLDTDVMVNGKKYVIHLFDTAGQADYDHLRPLSYSKTDVFVVCFSLTSQVSLQNVMDKWLPELEKHAPRVPRVLVGTKLDVRDSKKGVGCVSTTDGQAAAHLIHALTYTECSALSQMGLKEVFDSAISASVIGPPKRKTPKSQKHKCVIL